MTKTRKPRTKQQPQATPGSPFGRAIDDLRQPRSAFPDVSPRWLASAGAIVVLGALACAWLTLCLLYWQGSWQLLYHPRAPITRTPASLDLPYEPIHFATTETGKTQLTGWWIPAGDSSPDSAPRWIVLYLHGADGNLSDTLETLAALHRHNLTVLAVDYRGYGQSDPLRPNERQLRQDAEWSLTYLTLIRHIAPANILIYGTGLGANLAAQLASDHGELPGVILDQPLQQPMAPVFNDPRSRLVPARWLVADRFDLTAPSGRLQIPSLWLEAQSPAPATAQVPAAYGAVHVAKTLVWLRPPTCADPHFAEALHRWLDDLPKPATH